jgi:NhaC family Na+:H+ antiporter
MKLSPFQLAGIVAVTVLGLAFAYVTHIPLAAGFVCGLLVLIGVTAKAGIAGKEIARSMRTGIGHTKEVIWILLLVGLLIPSWSASGTISYLIASGLSLLNPAYFLTFSFLFSILISMLLGTSTGTLSSVGIPLMGVASVLHIPLPLAAGALVSGAFVGDRTSPFSSAHQLVASSTGTTVRRQYPYLAPTTLAAIAAAGIFYLVKDLNGHWEQRLDETGQPSFLPTDTFVFTPWLLLPAILLLGAILFRLKTRHGFLLSIASAVVLGSVFQGIGWQDWMRYLWGGFGSPALPSLHSKGVADMIDLVVLIALAGAFNGILEETKLLQPYMEKIWGSSLSMLQATIRTALFGLALGLVSCTQTLPIMMSGRNLLPLWLRRFRAEQLSRVVADTSLVFAALVPWNILAILCATILGVPFESYARYAIFLWTLPVFTLLVSFVSDRTTAN